jgi:hypothetical protein
MRIAKEQCRGLEEQGALWTDLLKAIDEYNYCVFTMKTGDSMLDFPIFTAGATRGMKKIQRRPRMRLHGRYVANSRQDAAFGLDALKRRRGNGAAKLMRSLRSRARLKARQLHAHQSLQ